MIEIEKSIYKEAWDYAGTVYHLVDNRCRLYADICDTLHEIERNDDKDGTNNLERMLYSSESLSIAEIVEEYGLV